MIHAFSTVQLVFDHWFVWEWKNTFSIHRRPTFTQLLSIWTYTERTLVIVINVRTACWSENVVFLLSVCWHHRSAVFTREMSRLILHRTVAHLPHLVKEKKLWVVDVEARHSTQHTWFRNGGEAIEEMEEGKKGASVLRHHTKHDSHLCPDMFLWLCQKMYCSRAFFFFFSKMTAQKFGIFSTFLFIFPKPNNLSIFPDCGGCWSHNKCECSHHKTTHETDFGFRVVVPRADFESRDPRLATSCTLRQGTSVGKAASCWQSVKDEWGVVVTGVDSGDSLALVSFLTRGHKMCSGSNLTQTQQWGYIWFVQTICQKKSWAWVNPMVLQTWKDEGPVWATFETQLLSGHLPSEHLAHRARSFWLNPK